MASGLNRAFLEVKTSEILITESCVGERKKRVNLSYHEKFIFHKNLWLILHENGDKNIDFFCMPKTKPSHQHFFGFQAKPQKFAGLPRSDLCGERKNVKRKLDILQKKWAKKNSCENKLLDNNDAKSSLRFIIGQIIFKFANYDFLKFLLVQTIWNIIFLIWNFWFSFLSIIIAYIIYRHATLLMHFI